MQRCGNGIGFLKFSTEFFPQLFFVLLQFFSLFHLSNHVQKTIYLTVNIHGRAGKRFCQLGAFFPHGVMTQADFLQRHLKKNVKSLRQSICLGNNHKIRAGGWETEKTQLISASLKLNRDKPCIIFILDIQNILSLKIDSILSNWHLEILKPIQTLSGQYFLLVVAI